MSNEIETAVEEVIVEGSTNIEETTEVTENNDGPEIVPVTMQVLQTSTVPMELKFNNKIYDIRQDVHAGHTDKLHKLYLLLIYFTIPNLTTVVDVDFYIKSNGLEEVLVERVQANTEETVE